MMQEKVKQSAARLHDFLKKNQDIILPALCIFGYGLAIGLAVSGCCTRGASIQIVKNSGNVTLDDVVLTGVNAPALVLDD